MAVISRRRVLLGIGAVAGFLTVDLGALAGATGLIGAPPG
jgi:hypothetical protein